MPEDYPRLPRMPSRELRAVLYSNLPGNPWREACKTELDLRTTTRMVRATYVILFAAFLQIALAVAAVTVGRQNDRKHGNSSVAEQFQRKFDCERYASEIRSEWKEEEREDLTKWKITSEDILRHDDIVRIFFSPQRNSCVCAVRTQFLFPKPGPPHHSYQAYVFDVLTKEQIWVEEFGPDPTNIDKDIQAQLKKLE